MLERHKVMWKAALESLWSEQNHVVFNTNVLRIYQNQL